MSLKQEAKQVAEKAAVQAKDFALNVNSDFDGEMDPLLVKWAKSPVSGWIACGFGVALLVIGGVLGKLFF